MPRSSLHDARRLIAPLRADIKNLLRDLVRTNSVAAPPHGNETPAQRILHAFFRRQHIPAELYDVGFITTSGSPLVRENRHYGGRRNLSARIEGRAGGKSLLLNGHMDTVPPGHGSWTRSPWSAHVQKGRLYGLGSFDMKGGVVAAAAVLCALRRNEIRPAGDVLFESVVDEEWGGGGGTIAARLRGVTADACIIPEGTQLQIYRATRGGFTVDLIVEAGDPAAYFSSAEVVSPAVPLGRLLGWIDSLADQRSRLASRGAYACFPDPAPVQVLAIEANRLDPQVPLSVPSRGTIRLYLQFLPEEDVDAVIASVRKDLDCFCADDPFFRAHPARWEPVIGGPLYGHELAADHPFVGAMERASTSVLGHATVTAAPYPCDAGLLHRNFGIPTLLFGPSGGGAHNPDEYVELDSVIRTAEVLLATAMEWTGA